MTEDAFALENTRDALADNHCRRDWAILAARSPPRRPRRTPIPAEAGIGRRSAPAPRGRPRRPHRCRDVGPGSARRSARRPGAARPGAARRNRQPRATERRAEPTRGESVRPRRVRTSCGQRRETEVPDCGARHLRDRTASRSCAAVRGGARRRPAALVTDPRDVHRSVRGLPNRQTDSIGRGGSLGVVSSQPMGRARRLAMDARAAAKVRRGLEAIGRTLADGPQDRRVELVRQRLPGDVGRRGRLVVEVGPQETRLALDVFEGAAPAHQRVEHQARRVDVGAMIDALDPAPARGSGSAGCRRPHRRRWAARAARAHARCDRRAPSQHRSRAASPRARRVVSCCRKTLSILMSRWTRPSWCAASRPARI